jgi:hypothetical protein
MLVLAVLFAVAKIYQVRYSPNYIKDSNAIAFDSYGYYIHLPATIIHHDPGIENKAWLDSLNAKYQLDRPWYQAWPGEKGRMVNVYTTGIAIIWSPFFLIAHAAAGVAGYPQDGLSPPYQWMIIFAGWFYAVLGLYLLRRLLLKFVSDKTTGWTLLLIGLGTNLYHYATYDSTMPHILLVPFLLMIILLTISWHENPTKRKAFALGLLLALVTISRPTEIVWILIPLLWNVDSFRAFKEKTRFFRTHWKHVFFFVIGGALLGSVQLAYWKYTSGHFLSNNHVEGFDFFRPFTFRFLFSYKKGWLLYTPLMIFALIGFITLFRKNRKLFYPFFISFLLYLWFISSWECWWYAGSFGQRSIVQSYGMLAIPLAFFIERIQLKAILKWSIAALFVLFTLLNQFQVWQILNGILHAELMTKKAYWNTFGKTNIDEDIQKHWEIDRNQVPPMEEVKDLYTPREVFFLDYEKKNQLRADELPCDTAGFNSSHCTMLDAEHIYGAVYKHPFDSLTSQDHLRMKMECDVFIPAESFDKELSLTFNMVGNRKQNYGYRGTAVQKLGAQPGKWSHVEAWFFTPPILHSDDILSLVIWNNGGGKALVDNVKVTLYEPKEIE